MDSFQNPTFRAERDLYGGGQSVDGDVINAETIQALIKVTNQYTQPLPRQAMGSTIPPPTVERFIDRGEIMNTLRQEIRRGGSSAIVGVRGMGGVGKTELAKFLAAEFLTEYPDSVLWVDVRDRSLELVHEDMRRTLGIDFTPTMDVESRYGLLRATLANLPYRLMVLDDVRQRFAQSLKYCLPPSPCALLITTRRGDLPGLNPNHVHQLDTMTESQALELLQVEGPRTALEREPNPAMVLAKRCGYHPLALTLAAKRLSKRVHDSGTPVAAFNELEERMLATVSTGLTPQDNVRASFELSYAELDEVDQARFRRLGVFASEGFSVTAAAAVWGDSETDARHGLERMQDASLVNLASVEGRFQLHDLLKDFAEEKLERDPGEEETSERALAGFLVTLFERFYTGDLSTAPGLAFEKENLIEAADWAAGLPRGEILGLLATQPRNWLLHIYRINDQWLAWSKKALELGISGRGLEANTRKAIGDVLRFRDNYDAALDSYNQALALFQAVGSRLGEANTRQAIGDVQQFRKDNDAALASYQQALALFQAVGDRLGEANVHLSLGDLNRDSKDLKRAAQEYLAALEAYQVIKDVYSQGRALYRLGDCEAEQEHYESAAEYFRRAETLWRKIGMEDLVSQIIAPRLAALEGRNKG